MRKLIYIEENFITSDECQKLIDLSLANKNDTFLTNVTHSNPKESLSKGIEWKDHTAVYHGGDVDPTVPTFRL